MQEASKRCYFKKYSECDLQKAIAEVKDKKLSCNAAANKFNIPEKTLRTRLAGKTSTQHGASKILSDDEEKQLVKWIILCANSGQPKTKEEILKTAGDFANLNPNPTKHFKNGKPGKDWFKSFSQRNPEISRRKPEAIGRAAASVTEGAIRNFFVTIYKQFEAMNQLELLNEPSQWWNCDETNFPENPIPSKVYAQRGSEVVYNVERGRPKANITCTYSFSADGHFIEPLITFKNSVSSIVDIAYAMGSVGANFGINQTDSGWMKGESFFHFVTQHLDPRWKAMELKRPIILTVDGYSGHHSFQLYKWCNENGVILLVLYPNATHILQVCDTAIFGPMKSVYRQQYQFWKSENPEKIFNEVEFVKLLKRVNDAVIKKETIINGWRSTGLQPFNVENVKFERIIAPKSKKVNSAESELKCTSSGESSTHVSSSSPSVSGTFQSQNDKINILSDVQLVPSLNTSIPDQDEEFRSFDEDFNQDYASASSPLSKTISFSTLDQSNSTFRTSINGNFPLSGFGIDHGSDNEITNIPSAGSDQQTRKLLDRIRNDVRQLGIHLSVYDPVKLLNILTINQQLNIIKPPAVIVVENPSITIDDVLKPPTIIRRPIKKRNLKLHYGVMSGNEVIENAEQIQAEEDHDEEEREAAAILNTQREKQIRDMEQKLREGREKLKELKAEKIETKKDTSAKRKLKVQIKKKKQNQLIAPKEPDDQPRPKRKCNSEN